MKRFVLPAAGAAVGLAVLFTLVPLRGATPTLNFVVPVTGGEEVPARPTSASGDTFIMVSPDGSQITYRLRVANIQNVIAAHIHLGARGTNGPIVAFLFGNVPPGGGPREGVLADGTITAANLIGPLQGRPLSALIEALQSGNAYVNVHTNDGTGAANTGAGDFPGGEVRGQIGHHGRRPRF
jgi:hypothetical protein